MTTASGAGPSGWEFSRLGLVAVRDGDRDRPGPASIGPPLRFVIDHCLCPLLLVWAEAAPRTHRLPPPPPPGDPRTGTRHQSLPPAH